MDGIRIISLGEFPSVTSNLFAYHYLPDGREENDQILMVDCGIGFPDSRALGVDLIIPDISYLKGREEKIVGILLTHGHEDHVGALPFILPQLPSNIPVYGSRLTASIANFKFQDRGINRRVKIIDSSDSLNLGSFKIDSARVTHSIPDTFHFFIKTPVGNFYHGSDFKFDLTPPDGLFSEINKIAGFKKQGVLALLSDCLGSERRGYSPSETILNERLEKEIGRAKGRVFITAISSNAYRWQKAIQASKKYNRKVALVGFSIRKNVALVQKLGYLGLKERDIIDLGEALKLVDKKVTFLIAGSLGQTGSSLDKVILGRHKIRIKKGDKVIFSSPDYIPGTSRAINRMVNSLIKLGADVIYDELGEKLHVSGHGYQKELALLIDLVGPKYFFPIGGEERHVLQYSKLVEKMGYKKNSVIGSEDGSAPTFWNDGRVDLKFKHKARRVLIDGLGIGDVGKVVLRDRRILAKEGMVVTILLVDNKTKKLIQDPEVITRGFVYIKESKEFLNKIRTKIRSIYQETSRPVFDLDNIQTQIQGKLERLIKKETEREPMVLPMILEV